MNTKNIGYILLILGLATIAFTSHLAYADETEIEDAYCSPAVEFCSQYNPARKSGCKGNGSSESKCESYSCSRCGTLWEEAHDVCEYWNGRSCELTGGDPIQCGARTTSWCVYLGPDECYCSQDHHIPAGDNCVFEPCETGPPEKLSQDQ